MKESGDSGDRGIWDWDERRGRGGRTAGVWRGCEQSGGWQGFVLAAPRWEDWDRN